MDKEKKLQKRIDELTFELDMFKSIAEYSYGCEYLIGLDGEIKYMSPSCEKVTSYTRENFLNNPEFLLSIVHKDYIELISEHLKEELDLDKVCSLEFIIISKDGTPRVIEHFCQPAYNEKGELIGRRASNRDITGGKYKLLYDSINNGVAIHQIIYDSNDKPIDYLILDVNPEFERIIGIKSEDAIGKRATKVYGTKEAPYLDTYYNTVKTKTPAKFETQFQQTDKTFNISVFSPEEEKFVTVFEDITERKMMEEELKESEMKLKKILNSMPIGINLVQNKNVTWCNDSLLEISGYRFEELRDRDLEFLYFNKEEYNRVAKALYDESTEEEERNIETVWKRKDGKSINCYLQTVYLDPLDSSKGMIEVVIDTTENIKIHKQLDENLEYFAHLVDQIRNPLSVISGFSQLEVKNERSRNILIRNIDRIEEIITQLDQGWLDTESTRSFLRECG